MEPPAIIRAVDSVDVAAPASDEPVGDRSREPGGARLDAEMAEPVAVRRVAAGIVVAGVAGALIGLLAKVVDETAVIDDIGTDYGVWVVFVTLIGAFAPSPAQAAARATAFMAAAMTAYYVLQASSFGFFSQNLFLAWLLLSLTAVPVWAAITSQARGAGWLCALATSVPVGLLLAEAWEQRHHLGLHVESLVFDLAAAVLLALLLPRDWATRARVAVLTVPVAVVIGRALEIVTRVVPGS